MDNQQVEYLPFHAINEFMLNDYRLHVLQTVFAQLEKLPGERRSALTNFVKRHVQVPGFRNSAQAPAGVKARAAVSVFERSPDFVAHVLQGWAELHPELRQQVFTFLQARQWEGILPPETDRTKLPGFQMVWPEGQTYDVLDAAFVEMFPDHTYEPYDLRLMIVWLAGRLPYDMYEDDDDIDDEEE